MDKVDGRQNEFVVLPFYIFATLLLGGIGIYGFSANWKAAQPALAVLIAILTTAHLALYWFNFKQFHRPIRHLRWWIFYYGAQAGLIIAIAALPYSGDAKVGLTFLTSATIAIISESLGLWGNTRRAFFLGLFYVIVFVSLFFVKMGLNDTLSHLTQLLVNGGFIVLIMILFNQQRAEREKAVTLTETLEGANAKLAAYAARNEALALQAERERMARELHDTLAQGVAGLILRLEAIKAYHQQNRYSQAETVLGQALDLTRNTLSESRAAIEDLRNEDVDFETAVSQSIAQFSATGQTKYELTTALTAVSLPQHIQHHARRVLYEALTNMQKHAQAKTAHISIIQNATALTLTIQDDGVGFDPQEAPAHGHFGLRGFQERAQLTGSGYTLSSSPQEGTTIEFVFPLAENGGNT